MADQKNLLYTGVENKLCNSTISEKGLESETHPSQKREIIGRRMLFNYACAHVFDTSYEDALNSHNTRVMEIQTRVQE